MNDAQIKHMVDRFLGWKLPEDFSPDAGISFKRDYNENTPWPSKHEPTGTNLFWYGQAEAMIRYMLEGLPEEDGPECAIHGPVCTEPCVWCRLDEAQSLAHELGLKVVALREALEHSKVCGVCADSWSDCPMGVEAESTLTSTADALEAAGIPFDPEPSVDSSIPRGSQLAAEQRKGGRP